MSDLILGNALDVIIDHRGKTPKKLGGDFTDFGVPVASALLVKNGRLHLEEARCVSSDMYRRWMPASMRRHDVILTSEAPLGRTALIQNDDPLVLGQRLFGLRGKAGILDSRFLYYVLQAESVQDQLRGRATGTTVTGIRQSELLKIRIPAPDFRIQQAIASALGALDDKITINNQIAMTADDLVRSLYTRDSIDPERTVTIGDLGVLIRDTVNADSLVGDENYIGLEHMPRRNIWLSDWDSSSGVVSAKNKFLAGDVLFGKLRPYFHKVGVAFINGVGSTDIFVIRPRTETYRGWLLATLASDAVVAHASAVGDGTRMPRAKWGDLANFEVPWIGPARAERFDDIVASVMNRVCAAVTENKFLAGLRDTLLPKLMSGGIRVRDAERVVEGAT